MIVGVGSVKGSITGGMAAFNQAVSRHPKFVSGNVPNGNPNYIPQVCAGGEGTAGYSKLLKKSSKDQHPITREAPNFNKIWRVYFSEIIFFFCKLLDGA